MKKISFAKIAVKVISLYVKAVPFHSVISFSFAVGHALTWTFGTIATQLLFDAISAAANGQAGFSQCLTPLLMLAGITFGRQIADGGFYFHFFNVLSLKAAGKIKTILHHKLQHIDPAVFEDTAFLDDLNKSKEGINSLSYFYFICITLVGFYGVYFTSIGVYLFSLKPILVISLLISFIPAILSQAMIVKVFTKLEEESAPLRRENEYYQKTLCDREYLKETRILGAFKFFHKLFSGTLLVLSNKRWKAEKKTALLWLLCSSTTFAGLAVSVYLLFTATMAGEISIGAFAAVFTALGQIFALMVEIISHRISNMNREIGKVTNFISMLDMPERTGSSDTPDFSKGVVAHNVSFTYPGRDLPAVKNVSLTLADGETIAIVGENGAGKSTLVRLLTGIYRPLEGKVTIGGLDTAETSPASVYQNTSGVFQKYQRYKMTLNENVAISGTETEVDTAKVQSALREAGAELEGVKLDDMLSPEFDGLDLSGGQWQRLAIARGLYRTNRFIILDEPTAAIDPIEETRVYTQFQKLAADKCAVVVTHRLGSAKLAHRIIVMDNGEIVDIGTHDELLSRPGKYADMWAAQAKWYERQL